MLKRRYEILLPLNLPELPCVMVNPRVPVATKDVFAALGLRNGELLVGVTDVIQAAGEMAEKSLYSTAIYHHQQALVFKQEGKLEQARATFDMAAKAYGAYLTRFPRSKNAYEMEFYYAECLYNSFSFSEAAKHYAMLSSQFQSVKDAGNKDRAAAEAAGYTTVYYDELPIVIDNWRPYVQNLQNKGVQVVTVESDPQPIAAMFKAMSDLGYHPKYTIFNPNLYDPTFVASWRS